MGWPQMPAPQAYDLLGEVGTLLEQVRGVAARLETATLRGRLGWVPDSPDVDLDVQHDRVRAHLAALVSALDEATEARRAAQVDLCSIGSKLTYDPWPGEDGDREL